MNSPRAVILIVFAVLCASIVAFAILSPSEVPHRRLKGLSVQTIEGALALADDQIDLATAALLAAKTWDPNVNIEKERAQLDLLAVHLAKRLQEQQSPAAVVQELNDYIFTTLGYKGVKTSNDPDDFFFNSVIRRKQGYCLGLSVFLLALAERIDLPLHGVAVPGHFFVRYDDGKRRQNIETSYSGPSFDDDYYRKEYKVKLSETFYLRNLTKKEVVGVVLSNLGNHLASSGRLDDALRALKLSAEVVPGLGEVHTNLGVAYLRTHKPEQAVSEERMAISINPGDANSYAGLAAALCDLGKFDEALPEVRTALSFNPQLPEALVTLGVIYGAKDLLDASAEQCQKALQLNPRCALAYANLGVTNIKQGLLQEAIKNLKTALELDPRLAEAHLNLAAAYERSGDLRLAEEHFNRARSLGLDVDSHVTSSPTSKPR